MALTNEILKSFKERFNSCKTNKIVAASVAKVGLHEASTNHEVYKRHNFQFSDVTKKGEITNQKSSGFNYGKIKHKIYGILTNIYSILGQT